MRKILEFLILSLVVAFVCADDMAMPEGYFVGHAQLISEYRLQDAPYDVRDFLSYIQIKNPNVSDSEALEISLGVIEVANCFSIDPKLFLALIRMESNFSMDAISPTGAVGLTQFTSIGAQEVNDQLGERGGSYANVRNINYLNERLASCSENWQQLWFRASNWSEQKLFFLEDIELSLIYGAILLKVYLAKNFQSDMRTNYYDALVDYNGEPGQRKYWYARTILQFYDEI